MKKFTNTRSILAKFNRNFSFVSFDKNNIDHSKWLRKIFVTLEESNYKTFEAFSIWFESESLQESKKIFAVNVMKQAIAFLEGVGEKPEFVNGNLDVYETIQDAIGLSKKV